MKGEGKIIIPQQVWKVALVLPRDRGLADVKSLSDIEQAIGWIDKYGVEGNPFGEVIYAYTRAQAVADGFQVEVTKTAQEAGIKFPVSSLAPRLTIMLTVPPNVTGQDEAGRLWDVVWMLRFAIQKAQSGQARLPFALYVRNDNRAPRLIKLIAMYGPLDIDDPRPVITVMMPDED